MHKQYCTHQYTEYTEYTLHLIHTTPIHHTTTHHHTPLQYTHTSYYDTHMLEYYSPDEDTYTLIDCIVQEDIRNKIVVDLGTSTGAITSVLHSSNIIIGTDYNMRALHMQPSTHNLIHMDLLCSVRQEYIDIVIFNPPYVLDSKCPIIGGGVHGREVIDRFIESVYVNTFYLLVIQANNHVQVIKNIEERGYSVNILRVRRILGETIIILKCVR